MEIPKRISGYQMILLIIISRVFINYTFLGIIIPQGNQDIWLIPIISLVVDLLICFPLLYLTNRHPEQNLLQYCEGILGKYLGKFVNLLFIAVFIYVNFVYVFLLLVFMKSVVLPLTPPYVILIIMLGICTYACDKGLISIGRTAELFVPLILLSVVVFFCGNIKNMDFQVFLPILSDSTFSDIGLRAFSFAIGFYQIISLCILAPQIDKSLSLNKIFIISLSSIVFFLTLIIVSTVATLGMGVSIHSSFPFFTSVRLIDLSDFIQRIESINVVCWLLGSFISFSLNLYITSFSLAQIFHVKTYKSFVVPITLLHFCVVFSDKLLRSVDAVYVITKQGSSYVLFIGIFIIPIILLTVYWVRKRVLKIPVL